MAGAWGGTYEGGLPPGRNGGGGTRGETRGRGDSWGERSGGPKKFPTPVKIAASLPAHSTSRSFPTAVNVQLHMLIVIRYKI